MSSDIIQRNTVVILIFIFYLVIHDIASSNKLDGLPNNPKDHVGTFCHYLQRESVLKRIF